MVIEKGSVIALKNASNEDINILKNGIGGYLNEGYGEVLINPSFLLKEGSFSLNKTEKKEVKLDIQKEKVDDVLISFLGNKKESKNKTYTLGEEVQEFIEDNKAKFEKISKSQWGQIRMLVQFNQKNRDYVEKIKDFITHGTSKKQWESAEKTLFSILDTKDIEFIKLLSMMMPKVKVEDK